MLRVISSTVQAVAIDSDQEEAFEEAVRAGEQLRETYNTDEIGQKAAHYQLIAYTDPNGQHRFAVTADEPSESDWQDTDSFDEALALYEETVQATAVGIGDEYEEYEDEETGEWVVGDRKAPFKFTDVPGVYGYEKGAEEVGNAQGRMLEAEWATEAAEAAQRLAEEKTQARQLAYARAVDEFGRGGNAVLARRVGLSEPTVKAIADKGRAMLKFVNGAAEEAKRVLPGVTEEFPEGQR